MSQLYCSICRRKTDHVPFFEGGQDWEYGVPGVFRQERCSVCELVTSVPLPTTDVLLGYYPPNYHGYQSPTSSLTRWLVERNLRERAKGYRRLIGPEGVILDVGAADGAHFDVWEQVGNWELMGFEFNEEIARDARTHGREIATATMETYDPKGRMFDLIIMNHLLEHVPDPFDTVRRAYAFLKPGGYIVGEVPSLYSFDRWIFGSYWGGCHWPRHVQQFSPRSITSLFVGAGFLAPHISYLLHTSHWALSIQNWLQAHALTKTVLQNGRSWYYPLLLLCCIPINLLQKLLGCTGIIGFVARKPS